MFDVNKIYQKDYKKFKNLKYLVIDCLRFKFHPSHFNVNDVLKSDEDLLKVEKMILTNLLTDLTYNKLNILPNNIKPAYEWQAFKYLI